MVRAPLGFLIAFAVLVAAGCGNGAPQGASDDDTSVLVDAEFVASRHSERAPCEGRFVPIDLPHETRGPGASQSMFDGMGAGLAVGDLDHDGDEDIVLTNLSGETSLLWNRGALSFEREPLIEGRFRHAVIVDSSGDGLNDLVLTTGVGRPLAMVNTGQSPTPGQRSDTSKSSETGQSSSSGESSSAAEMFERQEIDGLDAYTYSIAWGDLGGDGDLDAVTGAYNAELTAARRLTLGDKGGVGLFENEGGAFSHTQLAEESQALAVRIGDINADGRPDIFVGNDLATPDYIWFAADEGWEQAKPFDQTAFSTMGVDSGDIDNDGDLDMFATDMKPMDDKPATLSAYEGVMADIDASPETDNIQIPENVFWVASEDGFSSSARTFGIEATGWSWSGLFGDLDNDGFQDLYVVNGMVADSLFSHLPGSSLTEPNQAFRNVDGSSFEAESSWGLDDMSGGRGMAMADLDRDGDLDIVVNNLNSPSRLWENRLCGGRAVTVALEWEGTGNPTALGSQVIATPASGVAGETAGGVPLIRTVEASRGYLSGASASVHFGLGAVSDEAGTGFDGSVKKSDAGDTSSNNDTTSSERIEIEVTWPDGQVSRSSGKFVGHHVVVTRSEGPSK